MPCYRPVSAWRHPNLKTANGKDLIVFDNPFAPESKYREAIKLPCGGCDGCRIDRSRQWATRCYLEASLHVSNCFVTLTYKPEWLPKDGTLVKRHLQLFMKRLRRRFPQNTIRFFACGEYGSKKQRPHYHICIFNFDFLPEHKIFYKQTPAGPLYAIDESLQLWGTGKNKNFKSFGFTTVGTLNWQTAAYTARYIMKKFTGKNAEEHYQGKIPEFNDMSRRPGIARAWLEKHKTDVYPDDFVAMPQGRKMKTPKFFDKIFELTDPEEMATIRARRKKYHEEYPKTADDLKRQHECLKLKIAQLKRGYENET